jgi:hypothetical protein
VQLLPLEDHVLQGFALAADFLGPLAVVPQVGVLGEADDFGQAITFARVVKDTP